MKTTPTQTPKPPDLSTLKGVAPSHTGALNVSFAPLPQKVRDPKLKEEEELVSALTAEVGLATAISIAASPIAEDLLATATPDAPKSIKALIKDFFLQSQNTTAALASGLPFVGLLKSFHADERALAFSVLLMGISAFAGAIDTGLVKGWRRSFS